MLLELLQKGYLKLPADLAAVWVQARPAALLPVRAWY